MKSQSREIGNLYYCIALRFDMRLGSSAAEAPGQFQSDPTILSTNLAASRSCEVFMYWIMIMYWSVIFYECICFYITVSESDMIKLFNQSIRRLVGYWKSSLVTAPGAIRLLIKCSGNMKVLIFEVGGFCAPRSKHMERALIVSNRHVYFQDCQPITHVWRADWQLTNKT